MKIVPVVRKALLKDIDESYEDMLYWLSKTPQERIAEVTRLRSHFLKPGQRMDKTVLVRRRLHPTDDQDESKEL
ncbi:MAG TPA: hypothetical protein VFE53_01155 [Mucilaginibacter sp.]|jgi:hypothetical protein|nr:hypothetical protein [Mucilaginibacter sp.]